MGVKSDDLSLQNKSPILYVSPLKFQKGFPVPTPKRNINVLSFRDLYQKG